MSYPFAFNLTLSYARSLFQPLPEIRNLIIRSCFVNRRAFIVLTGKNLRITI